MSVFHLAPVLMLSLAACSATGIPGITPYKINVQQGNVVTQDMLAKLKPGMTRSQVRYVMGTPMIADPFHPDRWDYVYTFSKHGAKPQERRITIVFDKDRLAHIEGDVVPGKESAAKNAMSEEPVPGTAASNMKPAPAGAAASMPQGTPSPASANASPSASGASSPAKGAPSPLPPGNISPKASAAAGLPATPGSEPSLSTPAGLKPMMPVAPETDDATDAQAAYPRATSDGVRSKPGNPPAAQ